MGFFQTFRRSIYSPSFFAAAPRTSLGAALGYFFVLIALLTVIKVGVIVLPGLIGLTPQIQQGLQDLANSYPSNLTISVRGGKVSSNVQEPYVIPIGANGDSSNPTILNLIVID